MEHVQTIGNHLSKKYGVDFYFPSPSEWSRNCPNWWQTSNSPTCEDCNTPIIPTDSKYLPKEVCYPCHLLRERNEKIVNEKSYDEGVSMFLYKGEEYIKLGYSTYFESFPIAPFIKEKINIDDKRIGIHILKLNNSEIKDLVEKLEKEIKKQFDNYEEPKSDRRTSKFLRAEKVIFKEKEYLLTDRYHGNIKRLLSSLKAAKKAGEEKYEYRIYFKEGITYRDDAILRFVNYLGKGKMNFEQVYEKFSRILSIEEIEKTLQKLEKIGCVKLIEHRIEITETGKNIV